MTSGYWETGRGSAQCTLTDVTLRVTLRMRMLMLASWPYLGMLALLGHCGPRVAAICIAVTSGFVAQHSQHSTCDGSYPPLTGLPRRASLRPRFPGAAALVLIRHLEDSLKRQM
jgi:hypothetical protein